MTLVRHFLLLTLSVCASPLFLLAQSAPAAAPGVGVGNLLVAPTRIIIEGRSRSAEVSLINTGMKKATYRISFVEMAMDETGGMKEVESATEGSFSSKLLRYSPRTVTLEPNVAQTVRMQLRKPEGLATGEYRSHMLFRAVPDPEETPSQSSDEAAGFSIQLIPIFGITIPVIVRNGDTEASTGIEELRYFPATGEAPSRVTLKLTRAGNRSVYGNIKVTYVPASGQSQVVGLVNGIAVYTPLAYRTAEVQLQPPDGVVLRGGKLRVTYSNAEQNGEGTVFAEAEIPLS